MKSGRPGNEERDTVLHESPYNLGGTRLAWDRGFHPSEWDASSAMLLALEGRRTRKVEQHLGGTRFLTSYSR